MVVVVVVVVVIAEVVVVVVVLAEVVVVLVVVEVVLVSNALDIVGSYGIGVTTGVTGLDVASPPASPIISTDSVEAATRAMTAILLQVIEENKFHRNFFVYNLCLFDSSKFFEF